MPSVAARPAPTSTAVGVASGGSRKRGFVYPASSVSRKLGALRHCARQTRSSGRGIDTGAAEQLGLAIEAGAGEALATAIRAANTAAEALDLAEADGIPLGDAVATAARDHALTVLRGSPVAVDVICIDRGGAIVGNSA